MRIKIYILRSICKSIKLVWIWLDTQVLKLETITKQVWVWMSVCSTRLYKIILYKHILFFRKIKLTRFWDLPNCMYHICSGRYNSSGCHNESVCLDKLDHLWLVGISPTVMASLKTLEKFTLKKTPFFSEPTIHTEPENVAVSPLPISRRSAVLISVLPFSLVALPQTLLARERRNRKVIPIEDYLTSRQSLCSSFFEFVKYWALDVFVELCWCYGLVGIVDSSSGILELLCFYVLIEPSLSLSAVVFFFIFLIYQILSSWCLRWAFQVIWISGLLLIPSSGISWIY